VDKNSRLFVTALRDACNRALEDGRVGTQTDHIETIEVTDAGSPILLRVTCYGDYSPEEATRTHSDQSVVAVMKRVASYISGRALYDINLEELKK
jgi:acetaldehyde dehydrogenase (acetylating)